MADHEALEQDAFELMHDIERQVPEEIRRRRLSHRISVKARIVLQPGNASDLSSLKVEGVLGDISSNGCRIMTSVPLRVGDIYRVRFHGPLAELPLTFLRCIRCHLIREDAYENGFQAFHPIALPDEGEIKAEADLLARGGSERK